MKVDGEYAWLAGKSTKDSTKLANQWFFITIHDGGSPGNLVDHMWWDWLPDTENVENIAKNKVENLEKAENNQIIKDGDIQIFFYK